MKTEISTFVKACRGEKTAFTPIWYMRQAGRCIPAYKKIREKYDVLTISKTPELAAQVSLQPVEIFHVDAAILFADIMIPLISMGISLELVDSVGPIIHTPMHGPNDVSKLHENDPEQDFAYLRETIGIIKQQLPKGKAVIGFCGAPFTLASYLIEGKPTREFIHTKKFMYEHPKAWHTLMEKLTSAMILYLQEQIKAGIDAYQIFDSWVGFLNKQDYIEYVQAYSERIFAQLKQTGIPSIHFGTNTSHFLHAFASVPCDVVSIDWRIPLREAWQEIGLHKAIQGNLDPVILMSTLPVIRRKVDDIFRSLPKRDGFIFNLGHGILPQTPLKHLIALTEYVHTQ